MFNREKAPLVELQLQSNSRIKSDGTKENREDWCDKPRGHSLRHRIFFHSRTQKAEEVAR